MRLEFHRQIASDISRIMDYYEDVAGKSLANEFFAELLSFFRKAAESPKHFLLEDATLSGST
jgi:plasmid stabilization system protein ParE